MTINEAIAEFGLQEYTASEGDSITAIVARLYASYDDMHFAAIRRANPNVMEWHTLRAGTRILYPPKHAFDYIFEYLL